MGCFTISVERMRAKVEEHGKYSVRQAKAYLLLLHNPSWWRGEVRKEFLIVYARCVGGIVSRMVIYDVGHSRRAHALYIAN